MAVKSTVRLSSPSLLLGSLRRFLGLLLVVPSLFFTAVLLFAIGGVLKLGPDIYILWVMLPSAILAVAGWLVSIRLISGRVPMLSSAGYVIAGSAFSLMALHAVGRPGDPFAGLAYCGGFVLGSALCFVAASLRSTGSGGMQGILVPLGRSDPKRTRTSE